MQKKKILIIDDEIEACNFSKSILERRGFSVLVAYQGSVGLEMAKREKPDLILLDIMLPDMDGSEIAQNLLEDEATKNIPIVFITALARKNEIEKESGFIKGRKFVAKPITAEELVRVVEETLKEE